MLHDAARIHFGSDNYAGVHPEVLAAIADANGGHVPGYGDDPYTARLQDVMRDRFGPDALALPVFNGTGANVVALQAMLPRWGAVVAPATSHINTDENGAPERVGGIKILPVDAPDGRLDPQRLAGRRIDPAEVHSAHPLVASFSNTTELGTVHSPAQVAAIVAAARAEGMRVHCDGSRLANAAVAAGTGLGELAEGVDVLSLGATKNGALGVEAIVVRDPAAVDGVEQLAKINLQLASKRRFFSAQLLALFEGDLWERNARAANDAAARLGEALARIPGCELLAPVEANAVFARMPAGAADRVREAGWRFYDWPPSGEGAGAVRLMCAWDTPAEAVDGFAHAVAAAVEAGARR
ncbi:MAG: threonine aldolase [Microbacteriaceae bacterium]|nr:threonine aldolase [Microbacteriaceae bacterium]